MLLFTLFTPYAYATPSNFATPAWTQALQNQGWDETTATEVVNLNQDWFTSLAENYPKELDTQLTRLGRLGKYPQFAFLLQNHPELAGLLAGSEDPRLLAKTLSNEDCYPYLTQQYSLQAAPDDALALAKALERHGQMICALAKRGIPGASALFVFPHETTAGREYARWLDEVVRNASSQSDDQLAELIGFIATEGGDIRRRMERDATFRDQFRPTLWPRLVRTVQNEKFSVAVAEPLIWDLLALPQGENLLKDWGPEVPANLLFGNAAYPKELHETVIDLMRNSDQETMTVLMRFAGEPVLNTFLQRQDLDWEIKATVLKKRYESCPKDFDQPCPTFVEKVKHDNQMSASTLAEDLKPEPSGPKMWIPLISSYYTAKKMAQGRETSTFDLFLLGIDIVTVAMPVGKIAGNLIKGTAKTVVKGTTKEIGENMVNQQLKDYSRDALAKKINTQMAKNLTEKQLIPQAMKEVLKKYMPVISKARAITTGNTAFEATKPLQFLFEKTGVGRTTFKKWTGLEARIFMRNDAKVVIYPTQGISGALLRETAENAVAEAVGEAAKVAQRAWQQNASGWWLMNATNMDAAIAR
ncbi:MAG: hypothetical protein ACOYMW_01165 [Candidatus Competibacteraceae bacterium]